MMKGKLAAALVVAMALAAGGCGLFRSPPALGPGTIDTPAQARDAAIAYLNAIEEAGIPTDVEWAEENITPEGLVGVSIFRYTVAGPSTMEWQIIVRFPIVPQPTYEVEVLNIATGAYWQVVVSYEGGVEPVPFVTLRGEVVVEAEGTRSESWGLLVLEGPPQYVGEEVGLGNYTEYKPELEDFLGLRMKAVVNKVCPSFDPASSCCASAFAFCAPVVIELEPDIEDGG